MKKITAFLGVAALAFVMFFSTGVQTVNADPVIGKTRSLDSGSGDNHLFDPEIGKTRSLNPGAGDNQLLDPELGKTRSLNPGAGDNRLFDPEIGKTR